MNCPHCRAEIDLLRYSETATTTGEVSLDPHGYLTYEDENKLVDALSFECPECGKEVAGDFDTAGQLLRGE